MEMIKKIKWNQNNLLHAKLHPNIEDILFEHRRYLKEIFSQVIGIFDI